MILAVLRIHWHPLTMVHVQVRTRSVVEINIFHERWKKAAKEDYCWVDPYKDMVIF
jgi:hypothetical protein